MRIILVILAISFCSSCDPTSEMSSEYVSINGFENYIEYHESDPENPVLLVIHGGPGLPFADVSLLFDASFLEKVNIVFWHQFGAGNSFLKYVDPNDGPASIAFSKLLSSGALNKKRLIQDASEVVSHIKERFGKDRISVLGHSWGTVLSIELAISIPESLDKVILDGLFVNFNRNIEFACEWIEAVIYFYFPNSKEDLVFLDELHMATEYSDDDIEKYYNMIHSYSGLFAIDCFEDFVMHQKIAREWGFASKVSKSALAYELYSEVDLYELNTVQIPIAIYSGIADVNTPTKVAKEYFEFLKSKDKRFVTFEHSGHDPFCSEPEKYQAELLSDLGYTNVR